MTGGRGYRLLASANFGGLVLFCIEADFCVQILILQHFRDLEDYQSVFPIFANFQCLCTFFFISNDFRIVVIDRLAVAL